MDTVNVEEATSIRVDILNRDGSVLYRTMIDLNSEAKQIFGKNPFQLTVKGPGGSIVQHSFSTDRSHEPYQELNVPVDNRGFITGNETNPEYETTPEYSLQKENRIKTKTVESLLHECLDHSAFLRVDDQSIFYFPPYIGCKTGLLVEQVVATEQTFEDDDTTCTQSETEEIQGDERIQQEWYSDDTTIFEE